MYENVHAYQIISIITIGFSIYSIINLIIAIFPRFPSPSLAPSFSPSRHPLFFRHSLLSRLPSLSLLPSLSNPFLLLSFPSSHPLFLSPPLSPSPANPSLSFSLPLTVHPSFYNYIFNPPFLPPSYLSRCPHYSPLSHTLSASLPHSVPNSLSYTSRTFPHSPLPHLTFPP